MILIFKEQQKPASYIKKGDMIKIKARINGIQTTKISGKLLL